MSADALSMIAAVVCAAWAAFNAALYVEGGDSSNLGVAVFFGLAAILSGLMAVRQ